MINYATNMLLIDADVPLDVGYLCNVWGFMPPDLEPATLCDIYMRDGDFFSGVPASAIDWSIDYCDADVVAYRPELLLEELTKQVAPRAVPEGDRP